jgi:hypothetical protein
VNVDCTYWTHQGGRLTVSVRYALPSDFNPYADFYIGCNTNTMGLDSPTGPFLWDSTHRTYRVLSSKSWSYATFYDAYAQLQGGEVGTFEGITRQLLKDAEPIAHGCTLNLGPTAPTTLWTFGFDATVTNNGLTTTGGTSGSFITKPNDNGGVGELGSLKAQDIVLKMTRGSQSAGSVTLRITQPVSFAYSYGAYFKALVQVKSSSFSPCAVGAMGTLTVSSSLSRATLQVCHRAMLDGTGRTNANVSD